MIDSGGLSHQREGARADFLSKEFDLQFMESLVSNPEWATQYSSHELVEKSGSQGIELLAWLAMRASLSPGRGHGLRQVHSHYHIRFPTRQLV